MLHEAGHSGFVYNPSAKVCNNNDDKARGHTRQHREMHRVRDNQEEKGSQDGKDKSFYENRHGTLMPYPLAGV